MEWTPEADAAVKNVPFFVRKKVRARVEAEARRAGLATVDLATVTLAQQRFLSGQASEIRGFQLDACFGPRGCPNRTQPVDDLLPRITALLEQADLLAFLKRHVDGPLKFHHEFRISLAECPNACSQPQIKDIGIIGVCTPRVAAADCSRCGACVAACRDSAVALFDDRQQPVIDHDRCMACGQCLAVCPSGTLAADRQGFRVQLGGKLGRHPRLGRELPGIFSADEVLAIVAACLAFYKENSRNGRRFAELLDAAAFDRFAARFAKGRSAPRP
jgi:dissimilatory sulfite reductase (desulfoviridin) alpha/beta subunit